MLSFLFSTLSLIVVCVSACSCFMMHQVYLDTWVEFGVFKSTSVIHSVSWLHSITVCAHMHVCVCVYVLLHLKDWDKGTLLTFFPSFFRLIGLHSHVVKICLLVWLLFIWLNPSSIIITIIGHRTHRLYGNFDFYSLYLVKTNESNSFVLLHVRLLYNKGCLWAKRCYLLV